MVMTNNARINPKNNWALLKEKITHKLPSGSASYATAVQGCMFHRNENNANPKPHFFEPVIIVVIQGKKLVRIGTQTFHYGENAYFIAGVDMPVTSCVMQASAEQPYLSLSLKLDMSIIADLTLQAPALLSDNTSVSIGAATQDIEPDLLDALLRLVELTEKPEQIPVMEALLMREIHYRLLESAFGQLLRTLTTHGSQGNQITHAIAWLKNHYKAPLQVETLASQINMAPSTFHKYFKSITSLSPLQYQKCLRLTEAQRIMLTEGTDVAQTAFAVGYESTTQFIREYKRLFGEPPRTNIINIQSKVNDQQNLQAL